MPTQRKRDFQQPLINFSHLVQQPAIRGRPTVQPTADTHFSHLIQQPAIRGRPTVQPTADIDLQRTAYLRPSTGVRPTLRRFPPPVTSFDADGASGDANQLVKTVNDIVPIQLSIVSLLELICRCYHNDSDQWQHMYDVLISELTGRGIISSIDDSSNDMESLRCVYQQYFSNLFTLAYEMTLEQRFSNKEYQDGGVEIVNTIHSDRLLTNTLNFSQELFRNSRYRREFKQIKELGRGGFAVVYKVKNKIDQHCYAVKQIPFRCKNSKFLEKILREVNLLATLDHPNIIKYNSAWLELTLNSPLVMQLSSGCESDRQKLSRDRQQQNIEREQQNEWFEEQKAKCKQETERREQQKANLEKQIDRFEQQKAKWKQQNVQIEQQNEWFEQQKGKYKQENVQIEQQKAKCKQETERREQQTERFEQQKAKCEKQNTLLEQQKAQREEQNAREEGQRNRETCDNNSTIIEQQNARDEGPQNRETRDNNSTVIEQQNIGKRRRRPRTKSRNQTEVNKAKEEREENVEQRVKSDRQHEQNLYSECQSTSEFFFTKLDNLIKSERQSEENIETENHTDMCERNFEFQTIQNRDERNIQSDKYKRDPLHKSDASELKHFDKSGSHNWSDSYNSEHKCNDKYDSNVLKLSDKYDDSNEHKRSDSFNYFDKFGQQQYRHVQLSVTNATNIATTASSIHQQQLTTTTNTIATTASCTQQQPITTNTIATTASSIQQSTTNTTTISTTASSIQQSTTNTSTIATTASSVRQPTNTTTSSIANVVRSGSQLIKSFLQLSSSTNEEASSSTVEDDKQYRSESYRQILRQEELSSGVKKEESLLVLRKNGERKVEIKSEVIETNLNKLISECTEGVLKLSTGSESTEGVLPRGRFWNRSATSNDVSDSDVTQGHFNVTNFTSADMTSVSQLSQNQLISIAGSRRHQQQRQPYVIILYIQMQLCKHTLSDWLIERNEQPIGSNDLFDLVDYEKSIKIFKDILHGIDAIHEKGIIHRDLKPGNIFISSDSGRAQIGDFGLARRIASDSRTEPMTPLINDHTSDVGTPTYAAPEQINSRDYDQHCDLYSAGIILYELFFPFTTNMERCKAISDLRSPNQIINHNVVKRWPLVAETILKLTQKNAQMRPCASCLLTSDLLSKEDECVIRLRATIAKQTELLRMRANKIYELNQQLDKSRRELLVRNFSLVSKEQQLVDNKQQLAKISRILFSKNKSIAKLKRKLAERREE